MPDATPPEVAAPAPVAAPDPPGNTSEEDDALFEFTDERRYELYVERRKRYSDGAREAYHRLHQAIIGVSAGAIILSITFLKDIAKAPVSLAWLVSSWGFILVGALVAFFALITSAEGDRERIIQIDCLARTSKCDESRADRLGILTSRFNYAAVTLCVLGIICMIVFATANVLRLGDSKWQKEEKTAPQSPASSSPNGTAPDTAGASSSTADGQGKATIEAPPPTATASPADSSRPAPPAKKP
jgi:hypothetical protein